MFGKHKRTPDKIHAIEALERNMEMQGELVAKAKKLLAELRMSQGYHQAIAGDYGQPQEGEVEPARPE